MSERFPLLGGGLECCHLGRSAGVGHGETKELERIMGLRTKDHKRY